MAVSSRRTFLGWLAGAGLVSCVGCGGDVRDPVVIRPRWAFDSSLLPPDVPLLGALDAAAELGCSVIDLRRQPDARGLLEMGADRVLRELKARQLRLGLVTVSEIGFAGCAPVLSAIGVVGAEGVVAPVLGTPRLRGDELKDAVAAAARGLRGVVKDAASKNALLVVENLGGSLVHTTEGLHMFAVDFPSFGLALSLGRLDPRKDPFARIIENLGPRITRVALCGPRPDGLLPGEDGRDWDEAIRALDRCAYDRCLTVGMPGQRVAIERVEASMAWVESRFEALG